MNVTLGVRMKESGIKGKDDKQRKERTRKIEREADIDR